MSDKGASSDAGPGRSQPERREEGLYGTLDYKMRFYQDGREISPWHDIPLKVGVFYNMVTEIPASRLEKMEIVTDERMNPLKQDEKPKGTPRVSPRGLTASDNHVENVPRVKPSREQVCRTERARPRLRACTPPGWVA